MMPVKRTPESERMEKANWTFRQSHTRMWCFVNRTGLWPTCALLERHDMGAAWLWCLERKLVCPNFFGGAAPVSRLADYSMYSTFLTVSPGSVLFSRSDLLKRKDLCFSCLRLGLIRHRRGLRSSHLFLKCCTICIVSLLRSWYFS